MGNRCEVVKIVEDLDKCKVEFMSLREKIRLNSSRGKVMLEMIGSFCEFEGNKMVEKVFMGERRGGEEGYYEGNL
ncbi:recombinase family protein [Staphylococcus epidermidis]|uniref:recombinase family protein n=1 Tax=Staphylococcus epidermidis TaxID=1282 RepID=UPI0021B2F55F|nr:recombinase family protein [Staphylococcus epidermidis]